MIMQVNKSQTDTKSELAYQLNHRYIELDHLSLTVHFRLTYILHRPGSTQICWPH